MFPGTGRSAEKYKSGKRTTDITLVILNLDKREAVTIDIISNQEFTEVFFLLSLNLVVLLVLRSLLKSSIRPSSTLDTVNVNCCWKIPDLAT